MKLFASLLIGSQVAAASPTVAMCPETHPFKDNDGNRFCCEKSPTDNYGRPTQQCGDKSGCYANRCVNYEASDMCPPSYPFMVGVDDTISSPGFVTSACCKTASKTSCNEGLVVCMNEDVPCESYVAPSGDGKNLQHL